MDPNSGQYTRREFLTFKWLKSEIAASEEDAPQASPSAAIGETTLRDRIMCAVQTAIETHSVVDAKTEA